MSVRIMLDSGAYTAWSKGKEIDIDAYAEYVKNNMDVFDYAINLDSIGNAKKSYQNWVYLRKKGLNIIPVYHIGTDVRYLNRYCKQTDFIMLGAVASMSSNQRKISLDRIWKNHLIGKDGLPTHKVHGLGLTAMDIILRYPWFSIDSARAALMAGNGTITIPRVRLQSGKVVFDYENFYGVRISNQSTVRVGQSNFFINLPKKLRLIYEQLFEENGYQLGKISYVNQQEKAKKHLRYDINVTELFDLREEDIEQKSLANDYHSRFTWNLHVNWEIQRRLPTWRRPLGTVHLSDKPLDLKEATILYNVVASPAFIEMGMGHNLLISYAYLNKTNTKLIRKHKNYLNYDGKRREIN